LAVGFCGILFFALVSWDYAEYHGTDTWPMVTCFGVASTLLVLLSCSPSIRKKFPHNYALMTLFTIAESSLLAVMGAQYDTIMPISSLIFVTIAILSLALIAYHNRLDLTALNAIAFVVMQMVIVGALLFLFWPSRFLIVAYSAVSASIYVIFLVSDTDVLLRGLRSFTITPEEYVAAAVTVYTEVNLFYFFILLIMCCLWILMSP